MDNQQKLKIVRLINEAYLTVTAKLTSIGTTSNTAAASDFVEDLKIKRENSTGKVLMKTDPLSQDDLDWVEYVLDSLYRQYYDSKYSLSQDPSFHQYFKEFQDATTILKLQLSPRLKNNG